MEITVGSSHFCKASSAWRGQESLGRSDRSAAAASFVEAALVDTIERLGQVPGLELVLSTSRLDDNWPAVAQASVPQPPVIWEKMTDASIELSNRLIR